MTLSRMDEAILAAVGERWKKVARVIAEVEKVTSSGLTSRDEGLQAISERIQALVNDGRLASQGDIKNWRFSEIRRAGNELQQNSH